MVSKLEAQKKELEGIEQERQSLNEKVSNISKEIVELTKLNSPLAKIVLENKKGERQRLRREVNEVDARKSKLEIAIYVNQRDLNYWKDGSDLYITEQVKKMVDEFFEYIRKYILMLKNGSTNLIVKAFHIKESMNKWIPTNDLIPTGEISILDENNEVITRSMGYFAFPFKDNIYDYSENGTVTITAWYKSYYRRFTSKLLDDINKKYQTYSFSEPIYENVLAADRWDCVRINTGTNEYRVQECLKMDIISPTKFIFKLV